MTLVSAAQLTAIRNLAKKGMTSTGSISRLTKTTTAEGTSEAYAVVGSSIGWLHQSSVPAIAEVGGVQAVVSQFEWRVPVGTDIRPFDQVTIGAETFYVTDTDAEGTIIPYITCRVRRMV